MLTVTGECDNGMLPVLLGSVAGYVSSDYVYVTDEALATAAARTQRRLRRRNRPRRRLKIRRWRCAKRRLRPMAG
ncbi:MAG: hypothetical protein ACLUI3_04610 [Christensenellales bacterium]